MKKILLIEDSIEIFRMVMQSLSSIADIKWVQGIEDAKTVIEEKKYDLYLLDIGLPDGDGVQLCTNIQISNPSAPIFFLTAHSALSEKVLGFSAGAEDYITKPFEPLELRARVQARFRKMDMLKDQMTHFKWQELEIDTLTQEVKVRSQGLLESIGLTALEFKLLMYFANRVNHVVHRDKILDDIWGKDVHVYPRSVDTHVSKLRKKLGEQANIIDSIHGMGYKFTPTAI